MQVDSHEQKVNKMQKIVENYGRLCCCGDMTMDDRMQWLPGPQANFWCKSMINLNMYYRAQIKKMPDMIQVCTPHGEWWNENTWKTFLLVPLNINATRRKLYTHQLLQLHNIASALIAVTIISWTFPSNYTSD